jgi:hypothetical protein
MSENIEVINEGQNWLEAYKELATAIAAIPEIKWVDLWEEQPYSTEEEYPVPAPAVYLEFNTNEMMDKGDLGQICDYTITAHLYYIDIADTHQGSWNQGDALKFGELMVSIHRLLHGRVGTHHSAMTRVDQQKEPTPHPGGKVHLQAYQCLISDNTAVKGFESDLGDDQEMEVRNEAQAPGAAEVDPLYSDFETT